MANLERKARGAVTNEALSNITAEYHPKHIVTLNDDIPTAVPITYPNFWVNIQSDKDTYYHWSRRTPEDRYSTVVDKITFEDNTVNDFVKGTSAYALSSMDVDGSSTLEGTYCLQGTDGAAINNAHRFAYGVPIEWKAGTVYVIRFYASGQLLDSVNSYILLSHYTENGVGTFGNAITGTWRAISGKLGLSDLPQLQTNGKTWYEFAFEPDATQTGYLHFVFNNGDGVLQKLFIDNFEVLSIDSSEYVPVDPLDTSTALHLYGNTEYERRVRWGVADDRSINALYLILQRKVAASTTVRIAEG